MTKYVPPSVIMDQDLKALQPLILKAMEKGRVNVFNIQLQSANNSGNTQDNNNNNVAFIKEGEEVPSLPATSDEILRNTMNVSQSGNLLEVVSNVLDALPSPKMANLIKLALHAAMDKCTHSSKAGELLSIGRGAMKYQVQKYRLREKT